MPKQTTEQQVAAFRSRVMTLNGADPATDVKFNVVPAVEQKLEAAIVEKADFLKKINVVGVRDLEGEKVALGINGPIARRTNTENKDRSTKSVSTLDDSGYRCEKTEFDTHINWSTLDAWSSQPNFQKLVNNGITEQIARDRLMIGFNGEAAAAETDPAANPLLQDVNIGWLQHIQTAKPDSALDGVTLGAGKDFENIDAAVYAARHELIGPWFRNSTDLVAVMGSGLLVDKNIAAIGDNEAPTERAALQTLMLKNLIGTLQPILVPFFPTDAILITSLKNLSVYYQRGSRRRHIVPNPKRDRLEDYQSVNEAYVVEDYDKCALLTGINTPVPAP